MTIGGALSELNNLLKADDMPIYYKPSIKAVMDTVVLSNSENLNRWIPVSERLPEELMVKTLVSCEDHLGLPISTMVSVYDGIANRWDCEYKVIAWMPLPKPYKAESEDKERNV